MCTEILVSDVRPDVMSDIIDHAYGVDVNITEHNYEALLIAADMFQVSRCGHNIIVRLQIVGHFNHTAC